MCEDNGGSSRAVPSAPDAERAKDDLEARLTRAAFAYLARFAASREAVRRVLARRAERSAASEACSPDVSRAAIEAVLARCEAMGLIDDAAYAQAKAASLRRRGDSARMIAAKLAAKGVGREETQTALAGEETSERDAACRLARRRRLGPWRTGARADWRERDMAALARAGFSYDIARAVIEDAAGDGTEDAGEGGEEA